MKCFLSSMSQEQDVETALSVIQDIERAGIYMYICNYDNVTRDCKDSILASLTSDVIHTMSLAFNYDNHFITHEALHHSPPCLGSLLVLSLLHVSFHLAV